MRDAQTSARIEYHPGNVRLLCVASDRIDWSLKDLYHADDVHRNQDLVLGLSHELSECGVQRAYAPSVASMSGRYVDPDDFVEAIPLPGGITLFRNKGIPSDATKLTRGSAFVMSGGGCPLAVVDNDELCLAAHVGRESAIDRVRLFDGKPIRPRMSVIDELAEQARLHGQSPDTMTLRVAFQIPTELFGHPLDDPIYGSEHLEILKYALGLGEGTACEKDGVMYLDMGRLVLAQGRQAGFQVDETFLPLPPDGPFGHTRHPNQGMRARRNLVIVQYLP